jgi:cell wall-associated NlpC family hydrolase
MFKNKILKRIGAGLMAGLCAFTMIGSTVGDMCNPIIANAESTTEPLLSGDDVIRQAVTYLGVPYGWDCKGYDGVYSSDNPTKQSMETVREKGLDCSGLVYYVLKQLGYTPYRTPADQYRHGTYVAKSDLKTGDIVFFAGTGASGISHVGIYAGNGQFIHAPNSRSTVSYSDLTSGYWANHYYGARRIG